MDSNKPAKENPGLSSKRRAAILVAATKSSVFLQPLAAAYHKEGNALREQTPHREATA